MKEKINLIVLNLDSQKRINPKLEKYLIETNKKVPRNMQHVKLHNHLGLELDSILMCIFSL